MMNFPLYIAKRYLLAKKSHNIINIISAISVVGVTIGTMALVVVLSVFNGFESLVRSLYSAFDPDFKITATTGKTFHTDMISGEEIKNMKGVVSFVEVVEETALIKHEKEQYIVSMKGVAPDYLKDSPLEDFLYEGQMLLHDKGIDYTLMGYLVGYHLGVRLFDPSGAVTVYLPRRSAGSSATIDQAFTLGTLIPSAVFAIQQEIDSRYILVPIHFARRMMEYDDNEITSIEIRVEEGMSYSAIQQKMEQILGPEFNVKNRYQQQEMLYKIMRSEKWAIFLILTFILIVATFNVIGSLSMLILDKRKDIAILHGMGASENLIKRIFLFEGMLISFAGALAGMALGYLLCFLQIQFGLIRLGDATSFIVPYYPVEIKLFDFTAVFITVLLIGLLAAWYPVRQISRNFLKRGISEFAKIQ
jgi:lipoprotein-releasing system permease protein